MSHLDGPIIILLVFNIQMIPPKDNPLGFTPSQNHSTLLFETHAAPVHLPGALGGRGGGGPPSIAGDYLTNLSSQSTVV